MGGGNPPGEVKERDEGEMVRADDRLPTGGHMLGREDLVEIDAIAGIVDEVMPAGQAVVQMRQQLRAVERSDPDRSRKPRLKTLKLLLEALQGVPPMAPLSWTPC